MDGDLPVHFQSPAVGQLLGQVPHRGEGGTGCPPLPAAVEAVRDAASARGDVKYTVYFIGRGGKVLSTVYDNPAVYKITGKEGYVRARVMDSNGLIAWTQPIFFGGK